MGMCCFLVLCLLPGLHKAGVFKPSTCYGFCIPPFTKLMQRGRKQCRRKENKCINRVFFQSIGTFQKFHFVVWLLTNYVVHNIHFQKSWLRSGGRRKKAKQMDSNKLNPTAGIKYFPPSQFQYSKVWTEVMRIHARITTTQR